MACEGALLVVDATQGVEAQTLANTYIAMENNLEIIPVINKIDMASAEPERVVREVEEVVGIDCTNAVMASAKSGIGIEEILSHIVEFIPPPQERAAENLRALIFDSAYDSYRGVRFVTASLLSGPCSLASVCSCGVFCCAHVPLAVKFCGCSLLSGLTSVWSIMDMLLTVFVSLVWFWFVLVVPVAFWPTGRCVLSSYGWCY